MARQIEFTEITFVFPKPLNPYQHNCFRENIANMGNTQTAAAAIKAIPGFSKLPSAIRVAIETKLLGVITSFQRHATLKQKDKLTWAFNFPSQKVHLLLPLGQRVKFELVNSETVIKQLNEHVFPAKTATGYHGMGIVPNISCKTRMVELDEEKTTESPKGA
jgi:hypothetical protein